MNYKPLMKYLFLFMFKPLPIPLSGAHNTINGCSHENNRKQIFISMEQFIGYYEEFFQKWCMYSHY